MPAQTFLPSPRPNTVRTNTGQVLPVPASWDLLPPGDAALTRRVKAAGEHWLIQEKVGRKLFSRGVWAPAATIAQCRAELAGERSTEAYAKKQAAGAKRRENTQREYIEDFRGAVVEFLGFHPRHTNLAAALAQALASHESVTGEAQA